MSAGGGNWENPGGEVSADAPIRQAALDMAIRMHAISWSPNIFDRADAFAHYIKTGQRNDALGIVDPTPPTPPGAA